MKKATNTIQSISQRLLNISKAQSIDYNYILQRYGAERMLYRLSVSKHSSQFTLKGASLFLVWFGKNFRVTRDIDLLGNKPHNTISIREIFSEIAAIDFSTVDGLLFDVRTIEVSVIRSEAEYGGLRVSMRAKLGNSRIPIQVDIGFGDAITPEREKISFPVLLEQPAPELYSYPVHTVIAEKLEAMIKLGIANSRMKDFYDIHILMKSLDISGIELSRACQNTLNRRKTTIPSYPYVFTEEFACDEQKVTQWKAFVIKDKPAFQCTDFSSTMAGIKQFLAPIVQSIQKKEIFLFTWSCKKQAWI